MEKVLLIAPVFFNYYKSIGSALEELGYGVDFVCDAPSNSSFSKALGRVNKKLIAGAVKKYYRSTLLPKAQTEKYRYVLVVAGLTFAFSAAQIGELRALQKEAKFVVYQWDGEENLKFAEALHPYFDEIYTFDRTDSLKPNRKFLPLFYLPIYAELAKKQATTTDYDCSYVGTAHPKKYRLINEMAAGLKEKLPRQLIYHYMPSKLKFFYHKLTAKEYKGAKLGEFEREKMSFAEIMTIFERSWCVLDSPQGGQTGATIRTIECLGAKKKLVTANADVVNYDFYRAENIYVYDGKFDFNDVFFHSDYVELPAEIYEKYSLREWVETLLR